MPDRDVLVEPAAAADTRPGTIHNIGVEDARLPGPVNAAGPQGAYRCGTPKVDGNGPCPAPVASPGRRCPFHDPQQAQKMALARVQGGQKPRIQLGMPEGWRADFSSAPAIATTLEALVEAGARGRIPSAMLQAAASAARAAIEALTAQREADLAALIAHRDDTERTRSTLSRTVAPRR